MSETKHIKLSILIPSIPSRFDRVKKLVGYLEGQIGERDDVEIVVFMDNKKRTIGAKRNAIMQLATGKYFSMIDDDDGVSVDYVETLCDTIEKTNCDVITFDSVAHIEQQMGIVNMSIHNEVNEQWSPNKITKRQPFHMCAWKTKLFKNTQFDDTMYGEDAKFSKDATELADDETHINKILHHYFWDKDVTEAF